MSGSPSLITVLLGAGAVVAVLLLLARRRGPSQRAALAEAAERGDVSLLVSSIAAQPSHRQPDAFNHAIRRLWDDYQREPALQLIRELASRHGEERIAQYWLDQAQRVEPELAARVLDAAFLQQHYRPEVAARCGSFG